MVELSTQSLLSLCKLGEPLNIEPLSQKDLDQRIELARRENVYEESYDLSHPEPDGPSIPDELLALLYILLMDTGSLEALENSQANLPRPSNLKTELVGKVLARILRSKEDDYETTIEDDEKLLRFEGLSNRNMMAIQVRLGEKMVLREAIRESTTFAGTNAGMRCEENTGQGKRMVADFANPKKKARLG